MDDGIPLTGLPATPPPLHFREYVDRQQVEFVLRLGLGLPSDLFVHLLSPLLLEAGSI